MREKYTTHNCKVFVNGDPVELPELTADIESTDVELPITIRGINGTLKFSYDDGNAAFEAWLAAILANERREHPVRYWWCRLRDAVAAIFKVTR